MDTVISRTPTFEYYDVFREEIGSTSTQELYKFFDREGNILALRPRYHAVRGKSGGNTV